jgi:hypothetical protein
MVLFAQQESIYEWSSSVSVALSETRYNRRGKAAGFQSPSDITVFLKQMLIRYVIISRPGPEISLPSRDIWSPLPSQI